MIRKPEKVIESPIRWAKWVGSGLTICKLAWSLKAHVVLGLIRACFTKGGSGIDMPQLSLAHEASIECMKLELDDDRVVN